MGGFEGVATSTDVPLALSVAERIVQWLAPAFDVAGYAIIAVAVLLERSVFVGLIVPGDVILALGGVYAAQHRMSLAAVIVIAIVAAIIGESIGYWLGRRYGVGLIRHLPLVNRVEDRLEQAKKFFARHGGKTVFIGRYATAAGAFVPFTAGVARMPYRRFLAFDVPAIILWVSAISVFGYVFGEHLRFVDRIITRFGYVVLGLVAVFFASRWLLRRVRERGKTGAGTRET